MAYRNRDTFMLSSVLKNRRIGIHLLFFALAITPAVQAAPITVLNHSFEDVSAQSQFNEFHFGVNTDWEIYNPVVAGDGNGSNDIFLGTLNPDYLGPPAATDTGWFTDPTPDGSQVAILFGFGQGRGNPAIDSAGTGEYGIQQTLGDMLEANMEYFLEVEVGNIAEGFSSSGEFFPLNGFPGYRVDLMAGNTVLASDNNTLTVDEGLFATSTVSFTTGNNHVSLGESLRIRLVNLNVNVDAFGNPAPLGNDVEVDFDNVRLNANVTASVPESLSIGLLTLGLAVFRLGRHR